MSAVTHRPGLALLPRWLMAFLLSALLAACGGSGNGAAPETPTESVSAVIGPAGGTVTLPDGAQVVIPAGALRVPTTIGIRRSADGAPAMSGYVNGLGSAYEFTPHHLNFDVPVLIRLPIPAGANGTSMLVANPGEDWTELPAVVAGNMSEVVRSRFSWYYGGWGCAYNPNDPNLDPSGCITLLGGTVAVTSPAQALQLVHYPNSQRASAGHYQLAVGANLTFTTTFRTWADCGNATLSASRVRLDRIPVMREPLASFTPTITLQGNGPVGISANGSAGFPPVTLSHADNGRHVFSFRITCTRNSGRTYSYGDDMTINVAIPVPTTTQTVGGTLTGLSSGSVVLRNNGGDALTLSANNNFVFATALATGSPYNVSVHTQPVGQTCTVQNGSGIANTDISNVAVNCVAGIQRSWQGEQRRDGAAGATFEPHVAVNPSGQAVAAWVQSDGGNRNQVWAQRYTTGGGWLGAQVIDSGSGQASEPRVAIDTAGNATVIWSQQVSGQYRVRAAHWNGTAWGADGEVDSEPGIGTSPHLGVDASGTVMAVWVAQNGASRFIRSNRFSAGQWESSRQIDGGVGPADMPQVAVFPNGNAQAVWVQEQGGHQHIFRNGFNGIGWSSADLLYENESYNIGAPQIAADGSGGAIVVWTQGILGNTSSSDVLSARYSGGLWGTFTTLSNTSAQHSVDPRVALNSDGRGMVVWRESHADAIETRARPYQPDGGWAVAAVRLDAFPDRSASLGPAAQVGVDGGGNAVVVWTYAEPGGPRNALYASHYDWDAMSWGSPQRIENVSGGTGGGGVEALSLAVDADGRAIAVWAQGEAGTPAHVWSNLFR